jgi:hypothetical protein
MPNANPKPSLALFWLHWILANATGTGIVCGIFVWSGLNFLLAIYTILAGLIVVGAVQQLLLRPLIQYVNYWGIATPAMFLLGLMLFWLPGGFAFLVLFDRNLPYLAISTAIIICAMTCFGVGFSVLQVPYVSRTWREGLLWVIASALAFPCGTLFFFVSMSVRFDNYSDFGIGTLAGTAAGAIYGLITGGALVLILRGRGEYPVKMRY